MTTTVHHLLLDRALERGLRASTVRSYTTLLTRIGLIDREVDSVTREECLEALWKLNSVNTRRATAICLRSIVPSCAGMKIPKGVARRYRLMDETTLRLVLSLTPHQTVCELMAFAGLRSGEASAITYRDLRGDDRLVVDKQVCEDQGNRIGPVKTTEAEIVIPHWLAAKVATVTETSRPASVRESLRRAGKKVGLEVNPHQLRHWYASTLLERGVPLITISRALRHSDIKTTVAYLQVDDSKAIHSVFG
jgi:integrase